MTAASEPRRYPFRDVRLGLIGLGVIGRTHAANLRDGGINGLHLTAVADADPTKLREFCDLPRFPTIAAMLAASSVDAVLIATPHFDHVPSGIAALRAGLHVLLEKPIAVHTAEADRLLAAHSRPDQVLAVGYNQRTDPAYRRIRALVHGGEIGFIRRVHWTTTQWFRPDAYYRSAPWRGTWAGEGGGILLNQCLHHLDLLQWICGMPQRVRARCSFGRDHAIEVEDEVTALLEYANGATAVFTGSSGEAPGTNRLEIAGDCGRLVFESRRLVVTRNIAPAAEFLRAATEPFGLPATTEEVETFPDAGGQHRAILQNFADTIRYGAELIASAADGRHAVTLANAMLLSQWTDETIQLPFDASRYETWLKEKITSSRP